MTRGQCASCRAEVLWVTMESGKPAPMNPTPTADGNVYQLPGGRWKVASKRAPAPITAPVYTSHFATCPDGPSFRGARVKHEARQ